MGVAFFCVQQQQQDAGWIGVCPERNRKGRSLMTASNLKFDNPLPASGQGKVRVVKPLQFDDRTPQTGGMHRLAAVSRLLVGSENLWAGVMMAEPNTASSVHHHGPQETVVYVAEGRSTLRWGRRLERESELEAGDFLYIPPLMPHQEINPSPDHPALWIVVRSGPEAVAVDLTRGAEGEYVLPEKAKPKRSRARAADDGRKPKIGIWLAVVAALVLGLAAVDGFWLRSAAPGWPILLQAAILVLLAVLGIVLARRSRAIRHLAALDAFALGEMAQARRGSPGTITAWEEQQRARGGASWRS
jgi:uncharacterized RmlC-like cupin family protein